MVGGVPPASVELSPCVTGLLVVRRRIRLHGLLALLPAPGQQALNGVQVGDLGRRQLGLLMMGSPAFLGEVAPLVLLWRGGWHLGSAGLGRHGLRRRLLWRQRLRLLRLLVLGQLVRLKMMERLGHGRINSVLETRRRLRWLRREVLLLAGGMLHD